MTKNYLMSCHYVYTAKPPKKYFYLDFHTMFIFFNLYTIYSEYHIPYLNPFLLEFFSKVASLFPSGHFSYFTSNSINVKSGYISGIMAWNFFCCLQLSHLFFSLKILFPMIAESKQCCKEITFHCLVSTHNKQ